MTDKADKSAGRGTDGGDFLKSGRQAGADIWGIRAGGRNPYAALLERKGKLI